MKTCYEEARRRIEFILERASAFGNLSSYSYGKRRLEMLRALYAEAVEYSLPLCAVCDHPYEQGDRSAVARVEQLIALVDHKLTKSQSP